MNAPIHLSSQGSDRATGYQMSARFIRRENHLFVGWLDAPLAAGGPTRIQLGLCEPATGHLHQTIQLGEGSDNHCGPALALDLRGRLHAVIGAHSGPFLYRWSDDPADEASWSEPEPLGPADTYPSLAVDQAGTLHLAHRERADRWQLWYRRKPVDQPWEAPRALAISPTPGYNHFMQSLTIGPSGTVHLTFQYHYAESGLAKDCLGRTAIHLQSADGGDTWFNNGVHCAQLPLTIDTIRSICHYPLGGLRIGNHIVDAEDQPWLFTTLPDQPAGALWHRSSSGWEKIDLTPFVGGLDFSGGRSSTLARAASGRLHLVIAADPQGGPTPWFHPSHDLFHLTFQPDGRFVALQQLTHGAGKGARWLPALTPWDWTRSDLNDDQRMWLAYTCGLNEGGIGGNNANALHTDVYLAELNHTP
jgi:hypothetical protein